VIRWELPGPYLVAFTTRIGGVSEGRFASLNLGGKGDRPGWVDENRRLACEALALDPDRLTVNRQRHTAGVKRACAGAQGETTADALWTEEPGLPMLVTSADCLPIAIVSEGGSPALAVIHAGWRGLAAGVVEAGAGALRTKSVAVIGPAIGPCCYEVGPEVSALFPAGLTRNRKLDLWEAGSRALRRAGVRRIERVDLCTTCHPDLFFSHRRDGLRHGAQGVIGALTG
jgi:YfiH family protein